MRTEKALRDEMSKCVRMHDEDHQTLLSKEFLLGAATALAWALGDYQDEEGRAIKPASRHMQIDRVEGE